MDAVIASATPTLPRRILGTAIIGVLGMMILALAKSASAQSNGAALVLVLIGVGFLVLSFRFWQTTASGLVLTASEIVETSGRRVVSLGDIDCLKRGTFAAKPATGFALILKGRGSAGWSPGLWWRLGARVGIGGALSRAELRAMSDRIEELLRNR